jgi:thiol-disulfide isomerase/thioredoxin
MLLIAACASPGVGPQSADPAQAALAKFRPSFRTLDGRLFGLDAYRGRVVLLYFFAPWSDPAVAELQVAAELAAQDPRLAVIAVAIDTQPELLSGFLASTRLGVDMAIPERPDENTLVRALKVEIIPTSFLIGPDGTFEWVMEGLWSFPTLVDRIAALQES